MNSKRKSQRLVLPLSVRQIIDSGGEYLGRVDNLSRSGMSVAVSRSLPSAAIRFAWLQFHLPTGDRVRALGELVHETSSTGAERRHGYRFKYISPRERVALNAFMESQGA